ncbi:MAG TPA: hypothetical protein VL460_09850 [Caulobacteraceae bacterium]|jgi:hypothetical protein|nr:hypothetical protein [Caulobacteraceae bacterium]
MIVLAAAAAAALASAQTPAQTVESLERMYQQSCSVKAYGSYDDICNGLRKQMRDAEKRFKQEARAQEREAARPKPAAGPAAAPPTLALAPTKD